MIDSLIIEKDARGANAPFGASNQPEMGETPILPRRDAGCLRLHGDVECPYNEASIATPTFSMFFYSNV